jgi:hypothetical protein
VPDKRRFPERERRPSELCLRLQARTCSELQAIVRSTAATARPRLGKGNAPGRMKPRRARTAARGEIRRRCVPTDRGMKPLKRGRCGSNAYAPKAPSTTDPRGSGPNRSFRGVSLRDCQSWGGVRKAGFIVCVADGSLIARGEAPPRGDGDLCQVKLCRVTPRERAWLKRHQGVR